ncbi:MAG: nucleotidyltransferase [Kiritimatiellae bacterium]|nr:nucleotidyltransferase [Kiritimatiellia bacterium]
MKLPQDFREFLELFNAKGVEYMIVGSYALAYYGVPRYTGDIDLFVRRTEVNAQRIISALNEFGFAFPNLTWNDFVKDDTVIQLGVPPVRIDILTFLSGMDWDTASSHKVPDEIDGVHVFVIGREDYIVNKKASGRAKDVADIEALGERIPPHQSA